MREYVRRGLGTEVLQRAYRTAQAALSHLSLNRLRVLTDDPDDLRHPGRGLQRLPVRMGRGARTTDPRGVPARTRGLAARGDGPAAALVRTILDGARIDVTATSRRPEYRTPARRLRDLGAGRRERGADHRDAADGRGAWPRPCSPATYIVELGPHLACWSTAGSRPAPARFSGLPRLAGLSATAGTPARGVNGFRLSHQEALMHRRASPGSPAAPMPYDLLRRCTRVAHPA